MRNSVQLISYVDRLGGTVAQTTEVLHSVFGRAVGGVHLLPFFTPFDGADAGFDPTDHTQVDPRLGTWADIQRLAVDFDVVVDVIVNHVSSESEAFQDFVARGEASDYADMFLTFSSVFPDGATEAELTEIYRPRPGLPFTPIKINGELRLIWTTFTPQQIDIDVRSAHGAAYLTQILHILAESGVSMVRLDAVGYAIKAPGTPSFMTPKTFAFIADLTAQAHALGIEVLVEVHSYYQSQLEIASAVDWVYDFALPPLVLYSFYTRDLEPLRTWIGLRPNNSITVLDTHDGIGVIDVGPDAITGKPGLLTASQIDELVEGIHQATEGESRLATGAAASNLDIYQVNSTFYDALARNDQHYLGARGIQFFLPGIPQVYYVGALAGHNDLELLERTGVGRDINRHVYTADDIAAAAERPVVAALLALMTLRNEHPAFNGSFTLESTSARQLALRWDAGDEFARLVLDGVTGCSTLVYSTDSGSVEIHDLLDLAKHD